MAGPRILVIDADKQFREVVRKLLTCDGCEVVTAASGDEALRCFGEGTGWNLVLLDHRPGTLDGEGVAGRLYRRAPAIPVLMLTAHGSVELQKRLLGHGIVGMLAKPVPPDELRRAVHRVLDSWRVSTPPSLADARMAGTICSGFKLLPLEALLAGSGPPAPLAVPTRPNNAPQFYFRTLNGFRFWPVWIPEEDLETEARRVLRVFDVRSPLGSTHRCAVELALPVRRLVRETTGREYPASDRVWDTVCKSALSAYLWARSETPEGNLLVHELDREQLRIIRAMAGLGSDAAW